MKKIFTGILIMFFLLNVFANINKVNTNQSYLAAELLESQFIASLCPFEYGENVYLSRLLLHTIGDTTEYFNDCEYENVEALGKSMTSAVNSFTADIYPNPASTQVTVETNISLPASITLYSSLGQILLVQELNNESNIVNISSISDQLVLYEIIGANGETVRGLLQITH